MFITTTRKKQSKRIGMKSMLLLLYLFDTTSLSSSFVLPSNKYHAAFTHQHQQSPLLSSSKISTHGLYKRVRRFSLFSTKKDDSLIQPLGESEEHYSHHHTSNATDQQHQLELTNGDNQNNKNNITSAEKELINMGGKSIALPANETAATGSSILAIDPSTIEIIESSSIMSSQSSDIRMEEDAKSKNKISQSTFVKMFRGSANYIANHRSTCAVFHVPGDLVEWEGFADLMDDIALSWLLGMNIVIVAGSRHQIDERLDNEDSLDTIVRHNSIRVTDMHTLRLVKEGAGYVRFEIERQLARSLRLHSGMAHIDENNSGEKNGNGGGSVLEGNVVSGNFFSAQPFGVIDGVDYMYTGFVRRVEVEKIKKIHMARDIVLLTNLGVSPSGEVFNVNSESLAAHVAGTLSASKIIYFTIQGTALRSKDTGKLVQNLRVKDAQNLLNHYQVVIHQRGFASIRPSEHQKPSPAAVEALLKFGWSMTALEKGVKRAHIIAPANGALLQELYTRDGSGTLISRDLYEGIRRAEVGDVAGIYDLIYPLIKRGTLVERSKSVIEKDIMSYYVYTRDNLIVATGQLKRFEGGYAEIGCLVVSKDYRSQGRGDAMLGYLERLCLQCGASKVFVLSTQTMEWFVERGFKEVDVGKLPPSRRAAYNYGRRSKIYMKEIEDSRDLDASELWWNR